MRAIVLNKHTVYERVHQTTEEHREQLPEGYWDAVLRAHDRHRDALDHLVGVMEELGWEYELTARESFEGPNGHDLVLSLGGDGTVLAASHKTLGVPLLGINSDPERSTGYFCATTAADDLQGVLQAFEAGQLERFVLRRLKVVVDGAVVGPPALNDVLVANTNPAATSRYVLMAGKRQEAQKSSGVWISTAAGSTAGIRSAGGVVLPLANAQLQYLVREPVFMPGQRYDLLRGVRDLDEGLTIVSQMDEGCAYIDGPFVEIPLPVGAELRVGAHEPLVLLGLQPDRRER
jgi:NAD+ kinase